MCNIMRPMNDENPPIAHRKWLDNGICVDEPLYTCPNDKGKIPGHLNMVRYYAGQLIKELPASLRGAWLYWVEAAALWHDLGKFSLEFQKYIKDKQISPHSTETVELNGGKKVDHSTAGAKHASTHWAHPKHHTVICWPISLPAIMQDFPMALIFFSNDFIKKFLIGNPMPPLICILLQNRPLHVSGTKNRTLRIVIWVLL